MEFNTANYLWQHRTILLSICVLLIADTCNGQCATKKISETDKIISFRNYCLHFINEEKYWDEARDNCRSHGGKLIKIEDKEMNKFVKRELDTHYWTNNGVWIGLNDLTTELTWHWVTVNLSSFDPMNFSNWATDDPGGLFHDLKDCVRMDREEDWAWKETFCHTLRWRYRSICQFEEGSILGPGGQTQDKEKSMGVKAGVIIGCIVGIIVLILIIYFIIQTRKHKELMKEEVGYPHLNGPSEEPNDNRNTYIAMQNLQNQENRNAEELGVPGRNTQAFTRSGCEDRGQPSNGAEASCGKSIPPALPLGREGCRPLNPPQGKHENFYVENGPGCSKPVSPGADNNQYLKMDGASKFEDEPTEYSEIDDVPPRLSDNVYMNEDQYQDIDDATKPLKTLPEDPSV